MSNLVILGSGGYASELADYARMIWGYVSFANDMKELYPSIESLDKHTIVICGVGSPSLKKKFISRAEKQGLKIAPALCHPTVLVGSNTKIDIGTSICAGTIITVNCSIGKHIVINLSCTVGHESTIEDYCNISPHTTISGNVYIEESCDIGSSATILPGVRIGHHSVIGAGAVVNKDVEPYSVMVGIPAKKIKEVPHE